MMRRLRIARINWHTTDTGNGMPVHRAFDVMAPMDVHSARCLAIQPGRAASSPPRAGRNFFGTAELAENPIDQGGLALVADTQSDASRRNNSETRRADTGKIRGICSRAVRSGLTITAPVPATPLIIVERDDGMFAVGWHDMPPDHSLPGPPLCIDDVEDPSTRTRPEMRRPDGDPFNTPIERYRTTKTTHSS